MENILDYWTYSEYLAVISGLISRTLWNITRYKITLYHLTLCFNFKPTIFLDAECFFT